MKVAVGVIQDDRQRFLITQRSMNVSHGGFWEFPGGKIEAGETPEDALKREIKEEVNLDVLQSAFLGVITYEYTDKKVSLYVFIITQYQGHAYCCEEQLALEWVERERMKDYTFPKANHAIIEKIDEWTRMNSQP